MERALQVNDPVFESARDAHDALLELPDETHDAEEGHRLLVAYAKSDIGAEPDATVPTTDAPVIPMTGDEEQPAWLPESREDDPTLTAAPDEQTDWLDEFPQEHPHAPSAAVVEPTLPRSIPLRARLHSWEQPRLLAWVAAAAVLLAIAEAAIIGRLLSTRSLVSPPAAMPTEVRSQPLPTPRTLVDVRPIDRPRAAEPPRRGRVLLTSPVELDVFERARRLGSSATGPIATSVGRHDFELVNSALGYRSHRVLDVRADETVSLAVNPFDERISINALPWAEAWKCGWLAVRSDTLRWETFESLWAGMTPCFVARTVVSASR